MRRERARQAADKIRQWREDPVFFVRDVFNVEPDIWQKDVLAAFPRHQRIAMCACKGPGKTAVEAWLGWNFLATRPHPKVAATSITGDNLGDNLWPEMSKWQARSEFLKAQFTWTKTRIFNKTEPENWFMAARTWPKTGDPTAQADAMAGLHSDYIMFMLDEAGGIPDAVMATAEAALSTGIECKIVQAGNPTMLSGPLYRAVRQERNLWYVVHISGDPDDPKRSPRVSAQWAREQIEKYGRDNAWVKVNVFGEFPPASMNALFTEEQINAAMKRQLKDGDYMFAQMRLGCDVARFGDDKTVIFPRRGRRAYDPVILRGATGPEVAAHMIMQKKKWGSEQEFVDDTGGYGASVIDQLNLKQQFPMPVNFSSKAIDPRYYNKRAEMYFNLAEWVGNGGWLPNSPDLKRQLLAQVYLFKQEKMILLEKDQIKINLGGESPDEADALAETFALPELHTAQIEGGVKMMGGMLITPQGLLVPTHDNKARHDFDPYRDEAFES